MLIIYMHEVIDELRRANAIMGLDQYRTNADALYRAMMRAQRRVVRAYVRGGYDEIVTLNETDVSDWCDTQCATYQRLDDVTSSVRALRRIVRSTVRAVNMAQHFDHAIDAGEWSDAAAEREGERIVKHEAARLHLSSSVFASILELYAEIESRHVTSGNWWDLSLATRAYDDATAFPAFDLVPCRCPFLLRSVGRHLPSCGSYDGSSDVDARESELLSSCFIGSEHAPSTYDERGLDR